MTLAVISHSNLWPHISGYAMIEQLYMGTRTAVYRAVEKSSQRPVVIKVLRQDYPTFSELLQFRNQYIITKNLIIPGIIRPYRLEDYDNSYALVMEDFGGISLRVYTQNYALSLEDNLEIGLQIADILHNLCQHRIIHKDIKPANILIHPESKQVKLIDFSIASLLPRETQEIQNPNVLEGTLAYLSPEQTGRMNRGIDYRSDFYALGVTLYELLTGQLPFQSNDAMELVHCHLARLPLAPHGINPEIPPMVSEIVLKLMAKSAEDRYQSSLGLKYDLECCLNQWKATGKIEPFTLGERDVCDRFLIPEKLYGRETEVATLLTAFERVAMGSTEMMLVAGFSGIGKTVVINEVHKPIVRQRGYFIKGKYDQFQRNIPFSAFVQAFRDLMGQLLSESDVQLATWKAKILDAIGDNGQVIIDVIPELEWIIGKQPPVPALSGNAAQNRFNLLFPKFIQVFTSLEHPLVMFLDDLQWADSASLNLLQLLMSEVGCKYLLILGAYRDNEVFPAHSLMLTIEQIQKAGAIVDTITLSPLAEITVNQLVADTLSCTNKLAQPLTQLIYQKAKGNPFFTTQFLRALHEDGWIQFQPNLGYWQCDMATVRQLVLTDDVVEFMTLQLQKLPIETQGVLKLAACIGNSFDLSTLAIVSELSESQVAIILWKALQEGLILPQNEVYKFYIDHTQQDYNSTFDENGAKALHQQAAVLNYKFLHDRVQQAAYSLIPKAQKQATHLKIGQLLLKNIPTTDREQKIFDIVNQLNYGFQLITEIAEREELAKLNLFAGSKARISTAYNAATEYAIFGIKLLKFDSWQSQYQLTLELHNLGAEAAYLAGNFELMAQFIQKVLDCAHSPLDKTKVYEVQIQAYGSQNQALEAVCTGKEILKLLDIEFPENTSNSDVQTEINNIMSLLADQPIEDLINLPLMTDKKSLAAMRILTSIMTLAYQISPNFFILVPLKQVSLSYQYGNAPQSSFGYVVYSFILCGLVGDIESSYRFGKLSVDLLSKFDTKEVTARVMQTFNGNVRHWKEHIQGILQPLWEAYSIGLETGDLEFAGFAIHYYGYNLYFSGRELSALEKDVRSYTIALQQIKQKRMVDYNELLRQNILNLLGYADDVCCLKGEAYDEDVMLPMSMANNDTIALLDFYFYKLQISYLFGKHELAQEYVRQVEHYISGGLGRVIFKQCHFYASLARLSIFLDVDQDAQTQLLQQVIDNQEKIKMWANYCPMNVLHQYYLIEAEKSRVLGNQSEAIEYYDRAIAQAKENNYIPEEALANELAAKFYLNWNKEKVAQVYMQEAYYCYARWGAKAKTDDLEHRYPKLLCAIFQPATQNLNPLETIASLSNIPTYPSTKNSRSASSNINNVLDFAAILKASQSLSSTIKLDELIHQLTRIILQHSGGDRCVLILPNQAGKWQSAAVATPNTIKLCSEPLDGNANLPVKLIQYVKNTQKVVMLDNLKTDLSVIDDYLIQRQPKSVLCLPILNQGHLIGILYLKNRTTSGVFTSDRILILNFLCTQAAISLENARLYQILRESETKFRAFVEDVNDLIYSITPEGIFTYLSPQFQEMWGYEVDEFLHKSFLPLVHPEDIAIPITSNQRLLETGEKQSDVEFRIKRQDGSWCWITCNNSPIKDEHGRVIGLRGIARDISERKQADETILQKSLELEKAVAQLQNTQLQMVQNEKMASLGNLVAGVAHEINNPIGFLNGSINNGKDYVQDLLKHLALYQQHYPEPALPIQDHSEEIDLEFLCEDLPKLLNSMKGATDRIKSISTSLRTFSRADTEHKVSANLHEGIDSTVLILKYRLKANEFRHAIQVIQDYGNLPVIECFPGQLNQVFMNILANAIDMFDEMAKTQSFSEIATHPQQITIRTTMVENQVQIRIRDNGKGMTEDVKARIFDHLFTTKGVGKGTGLGLAIARQIVVEKHGGSLEVESDLGRGTEFVIKLPIS